VEMNTIPRVVFIGQKQGRFSARILQCDSLNLARYLDDGDHTTAVIFYENTKLRRKEKRERELCSLLNYDYSGPMLCDL
jgi:hypothetical protein